MADVPATFCAMSWITVNVVTARNIFSRLACACAAAENPTAHAMVTSQPIAGRTRILPILRTNIIVPKLCPDLEAR
jgi:hypothetical protein